MSDFVTRHEYEDTIALLSKRLREVTDQLEAVAAGGDITAHNLAYFRDELATWIRVTRPLLSAEQNELLTLEQRAGVTETALKTEHENEAGDGDEWRRRLKARAEALAPGAAPGALGPLEKVVHQVRDSVVPYLL